MTQRVIVVEDDVSVGKVLTALLGQVGYAATLYTHAEPALLACERGAVDLAITDLRLVGMDGMGFLSEALRRAPGLPVVMLTAYGSVPVAVEAMKRGACDFLQKPVDRDALLHVVQKALLSGAAGTEGPAATAAPLMDSPELEAVRAQALRVANTKSTVLLQGETGTGKEVMARFIHDHSPRRAAPLVVVNCAALPESLIESELFGHEKGAFTGATHARPGRVQLAAGGTLFLDEVGELPLRTQGKLLRVLQEHEVQPVGSERTIEVDLRVIAATHRALDSDVQIGRFREDLYYRLAVFPLALPPLREREGAVRALAQHFLARQATELGRELRLSEGAIRALEAHGWPGNIRELENAVERIAILLDGAVVERADVERALVRSPRFPSRSEPPSLDLGARRHAAERTALVEALERSGGNRARAARLLGVSRRTLYNKLVELKVAPAEDVGDTPSA